MHLQQNKVWCEQNTHRLDTPRFSEMGKSAEQPYETRTYALATLFVGSAQAQFALGYHLSRGYGGFCQNPLISVDMFQIACEQHHLGAMYSLV